MCSSDLLGTAWVRVSGTWATKTYYDFDNTTGGTAPEGYLNVLTKEQWIGVLDFVKAIDAKLMISVANCPGLHSAEEPWNPSEAEKIFRLSKEYGVPIDGAEFANEPNMMEDTGFPAGYTPADYRRDQDLFFAWVRANYPECICIGPSSVGEGLSFNSGDNKSGGIEQLVRENCSTTDLLEGTKEPLDVFSYHYYNGVSERLASVMPSGHWLANTAHTEAYLDVALNCARTYAPLRDKYCPGGEMWVTESGDAGACGRRYGGIISSLAAGTGGCRTGCRGSLGMVCQCRSPLLCERRSCSGRAEAASARTWLVVSQ